MIIVLGDCLDLDIYKSVTRTDLMPRIHLLYSQIISRLCTVSEFGGLKAENVRVSRLIRQQAKKTSLHCGLQREDTRLLLRRDVRQIVAPSVSSNHHRIVMKLSAVPLALALSDHPPPGLGLLQVSLINGPFQQTKSIDLTMQRLMVRREFLLYSPTV